MQADLDVNALARRAGQELTERLRDLCFDPERPEAFARQVAMAVDECLQQLNATGYVGEANRLPSGEFWRAAEDIMRVGSLQLHAREKPLGYPGDHLLLDRVCRNDVRGSGLAWAFDTYFQRQAAPQAVRNRGRETAAAIRRIVEERDGRLTRVASVGSGPAWDIRWGLESLSADLRRRVVVTLVDLDPRAGDFCQAQLGDLLPPEQLRIHRANLKRLPRLKSLQQSLAASDLLVCPGFFDYLSHPEAATMLTALWNCVAPAGELLVFNFSANNPSRPYMEWVGNWYLQYRTEAEMEKLASAAQLVGGRPQVGVERANVNLFLRVTREPPSGL